MSLNFPNPLNCVAVCDPRLELSNQRDYAVIKSAQAILYKQYTTTSISNSSLSFSAIPPSSQTVIDRVVKLYCPVRIQLFGTIGTVGDTLLNPGCDSPRQFGLQQSLDTIIMTINSQSMSIKMSDILNCMLCYNQCEELRTGQYSTTPTCPDTSQEYTALQNSIRSPMSRYWDTQTNSTPGNGAFANFVIISNPVATSANQAVTAIVDVAFCEPIFLPPLVWGKKNFGGLFNATAFDFTFNFLNAGANRMWSHDPTVTQFGAPMNVITSTSFAIGSMQNGPTSFGSTTGTQPYLFFQYLTPNQQQLLGPLSSISYPYFEIQSYQTTSSMVLAAPWSNNIANPGNDNQARIVSNTIQLNSIPRHMYIYVREQNQQFYSTCQNTDSFFQINGLNIQYQTQAGLLNSANMIQIYDICVKNGCNLSFNEWSGGPVYSNAVWAPTGAGYNLGQYGTKGGVVKLCFGIDLPLVDLLDAPGKISPNTLQITVDCANMSARNIIPTLFIVIVNEGVFDIISMNRAAITIAPLTSVDIMNAMQSPNVDYYSTEDIQGGDWLSGFRAFGSKIADWGSRLHNFVKDNGLISKALATGSILFPKIAPIGVPAAAIARTFGYGAGEGGVLLDGLHSGGVHAGVRASGGKHLPKRNLRQRASKMH